MLNCKVRFAPSPTGYMHIGNARVAIINYLFCIKNGGKFLFRIDDTDSQRSKREYENAIINDLNWLGITYDETFRQSSRLARYNEVLDKLYKQGLVYKCFETPEELEFKRKRALLKGLPPVYNRSALTLTQEQIHELEKSGTPSYWRFKLPDKTVSWNDLVLGKISYNLANISDPVISKSDGTYLYSFCSVIDDLDFKISHILRGQDHVTNTAAQIAMIEAISEMNNTIIFGHFSLLINKDGSQFSKRLGSLNLENLRNIGIDRMSIWNLLATLGTSKDTSMFLSIENLADYFDISSFSVNSPKFDIDQLLLLNKKLIRSMTYGEISKCMSLKMSEQQYLIIKENIDNYKDLENWDNILDSNYIPVIQKIDNTVINCFTVELENIKDENLTQETATNLLKSVSEKIGVKGKELCMPIQKVILGVSKAPRLADAITLFSKTEILRRLKLSQ